MLLIILLLPAAIAVFCGLQRGDLRPGAYRVMAAAQAAVTLLCGAAALRGGYETPLFHLTDTLTFSLRTDAMGGLFAVLTAVFWLLSIPYSSVYMKHEHGEPGFFCFLFLTESAMLGAAFAGDMMTLYLFFELTTLCSAPLVLHSRTGKALMGAGKYLYFSMAGAFAVLFGMAVVFSQGGTLVFAKGGVLSGGGPLLLLAAFCMILGFSTKAGLYPMHAWLTAAHPVAPAPASALLSGIITKVGVLGVIRTVYFLVGPGLLQGTWVQHGLLLMALLTVFMGSLMAASENGLKKRLAFSSISNLSYVLLGVFLMTPLGLVGALLQLLFHAMAKIGIFQCAGACILLTETDTLDGFRGLGKRIPVTMLCFTLFALSLVGIPPFGGFYSKWYLALAGLSAMPSPLRYAIPAVLLASALLTAVYLFWPLTRAVFPGRDFPAPQRIREPRRMLLPMVLLSALCLVLGILHPAVTRVMEGIAAAIL